MDAVEVSIRSVLSRSFEVVATVVKITLPGVRLALVDPEITLGEEMIRVSLLSFAARATYRSSESNSEEHYNRRNLYFLKRVAVDRFVRRAEQPVQRLHRYRGNTRSRR